jgi:hypothetical protein
LSLRQHCFSKEGEKAALSASRISILAAFAAVRRWVGSLREGRCTNGKLIAEALFYFIIVLFTDIAYIVLYNGGERSKGESNENDSCAGANCGCCNSCIERAVCAFCISAKAANKERKNAIGL